MRFNFETPIQQVAANNSKEGLDLLIAYADMRKFIISSTKKGVRIGCDVPPKDILVAEWALLNHTNRNIGLRMQEKDHQSR